jgi:Plasmid pRiA4b ORF-3-like protein
VAKGSQAYRFRITLRDVAPAIWREVEVPISYTLWDLHVALQDAMGWQDCHLHVFKFRQLDSHDVVEVGIPDPDLPPGADSVLPGWEHRVSEYFPQPGAAAVYEYDFGDGWEHDLVLEAVVRQVAGEKYPRCGGGLRACPPEDCGGPDGYARLLDIMGDPQHEEFESMVTWLGRKLDPEAFDRSAVKFRNPKRQRKRAFGP